MVLVPFDFKVPSGLVNRCGTTRGALAFYRTEFMRDRDRVMSCSSFRRLAGKTQIYLTGKNDNQRNRLTHTLEVAQIARTVAQALNLDCDLTEAIALGHDMGHTPFGHAGEEILHEIMVPGSKVIRASPMEGRLSKELISENLFGFKHNIQSVRVAVSLEKTHEDYGLNLTNYTLWGIMHHSTLDYKEGRVSAITREANYRKQYDELFAVRGYYGKEAWSFEAFVVAEADEIAQWDHDMEDAIRGKAMTISEVCKTLLNNLRGIINQTDRYELLKIEKVAKNSLEYIPDISRILVNTLVSRLIVCSKYNLSHLWAKYHLTEKNKKAFFLQHSWAEEEIQSAINLEIYNEENMAIQGFESKYPNVIKENVHHSREVERMNETGKFIIRKLFSAYFSHPQQLPNSVVIQYMTDIGEYIYSSIGANRTKFAEICSRHNCDTYRQIILMRRICDYIAGMTDRYAREEYRNLYG